MLQMNPKALIIGLAQKTKRRIEQRINRPSPRHLHAQGHDDPYSLGHHSIPKGTPCGLQSKHPANFRLSASVGADKFSP